jgi:hypothetical protein
MVSLNSLLTNQRFFAGLKAGGRENPYENLQRLVVGAVGIEPTTSPV